MKTILYFLCFFVSLIFATAPTEPTRKKASPRPTPADLVGSWILDERTHLAKDEKGDDVLRVVLRHAGEEGPWLTLDESASKRSALSQVTFVIISGVEVTWNHDGVREKYFYLTIKYCGKGKVVYERVEILGENGLPPPPTSNPKPFPPEKLDKKMRPDGGRALT